MGLNLGGLLKSVVNPMTLAQLAMGPAGWASILAKAVISAIGQQVIQQLGQKLGLPDGVINLAQQAFSGAMGGGNALGGALGGANALGRTAGGALSVADAVKQVAEGLNLNAQQEGRLARNTNDTVQVATKRLVDQLMESEEFKSAKNGAKGGKAGESILMRIAIALGSLADKKMGEMDKLAQQIGATKDGKNQNKISEMGAKLQALSQEMSILSNAMTNVIKSIGEANSTIARKG